VGIVSTYLYEIVFATLSVYTAGTAAQANAIHCADRSTTALLEQYDTMQIISINILSICHQFPATVWWGTRGGYEVNTQNNNTTTSRRPVLRRLWGTRARQSISDFAGSITFSLFIARSEVSWPRSHEVGSEPGERDSDAFLDNKLN
jgi:hypothetical protein